MKKWSKLSVLGLAAAMALNCAACGANTGSAGAGSEETQQMMADGAADSGLYTATVMQDGNSDVDSEDIMQKIFEVMTKADSDYSQIKTYDTSTEYSESLDGDTMSFTAKGEYVNGTWEFVKEGDYIVNTSSGDDYMPSILFSYLSKAAGECLGMDTDLLNGYLKAISMADLESEYVTMSLDEAANTITYKLSVAGPYDFSVLDSLYLDRETLDNGIIEALGENSSNSFIGVGKVNLYSLGSKDSLDIYMAEHGGLTDLTYKSLIEAVKALQPDGYQEFVDSYTKLAEVEEEGWQVSFVEDREDIPEFFWDLDEHQKFLKVHFGEKYDEE